MAFPSHFQWGTATASYQIEGSWDQDGRGLTIWDAFSHTQGKVMNNDTGDEAVDHYHRFREDVKLIQQMNVKQYRFSIAWSRLLPTGYRYPKDVMGESIDGVNEKGLAFYNQLIDCLVEHGIQPVVTLYHWDLPLNLQMELDGWLDQSGAIGDAFVQYADLCFKHFGDRVKTWITFNEPWCVTVLGHGNGHHAPGRSIYPNIEPYLAGHSLLLAHAKTVQLYRQVYQKVQGGLIGITLNCDWREPKDVENPKHAEASETSLLFNLGWFADPVYLTGDYPEVMKRRCGNRLPTFSLEEQELLRHSSDFFGLNHYSTMLIEPRDPSTSAGTTYWDDIDVQLSSDPEWKQTDMGWNVVPWGLRKLLCWIQHRYEPQGGIIVTENGCAVKEDTVEAGVEDTFRLAFLQGYIGQMHQAITREGVDCRGYFVWSLLDNFEWAFGYQKRFGLHYVDYTTQQRTPKSSAQWYANLVAKNRLEE